MNSKCILISYESAVFKYVNYLWKQKRLIICVFNLMKNLTITSRFKKVVILIPKVLEGQMKAIK